MNDNTWNFTLLKSLLDHETFVQSYIIEKEIYCAAELYYTWSIIRLQPGVFKYISNMRITQISIGST